MNINKIGMKSSRPEFLIIPIPKILSPIPKTSSRSRSQTRKNRAARPDCRPLIWICSLHLNNNNFRIIWDTEIWTMSPPVLQLIFSLFLNRCHLASVLTLNFLSRFCNLYRLYKIYSFFHYFSTMEEQKLFKISISPSCWAVPQVQII